MNIDPNGVWFNKSDHVIEINLKEVFPALWLNIYKLNLLLGGNLTMTLKYKRDLIFTEHKVYIVNTRSSLKRVGGKV